MGRDKGLLLYGGKPQAQRAWELLSSVCGHAFVSVRHEQSAVPPYSDLPSVVDEGTVVGPAAGLLAGWSEHADVAWLLLAADMPLVDESLLHELISVRDPAKLATAFRHPDGTPEPLCTIWEPAAAGVLRRRAGRGLFSLREILEPGEAGCHEPARPERLASIDTSGEYARTRDLLEAAGR